MYRPISIFLYVLLKVIMRKIKVKGKQFKPSDERYVVTCTHTSMVEIVALSMAVFPHEIHYMAKQELFKSKFSNWFFTSVNAFPVNRENPGPSTLKTPVKLLQQGKTIGMFPAGSRQAGAPVKRGAATIAVLGKAPILPAAYVGPKKFREIFTTKQKCWIQFGELIDTNQYLSEYKKSEAIDKITETLETRLNDLSDSLSAEIRK